MLGPTLPQGDLPQALENGNLKVPLSAWGWLGGSGFLRD